MAVDLFASHPDLSREESTNLTAPAVSGQKALAVQNSAGFAIDDYVVIGEIGSESAEIGQIDSISSATSITLKSNLGILHGASQSLTKIPYNQIKIYYDTTSAGSFANQIAGSPAGITVDESETKLNDPVGSSARWYKFTFFNSTTAAETSKADSIAVQGGIAQELFTLEELKQEIDLKPSDKSHDADLLKVIAAVTSKIINETNVQYIPKTVTDEYHDIEDGQSKVFVDYYPIYGIPTVVNYKDTLVYNADPELTDFHVYPGYVERRFGAYFFPGRKRFKISYVAYEPIDDDLKKAAIQMAGIISGLKTRTFTDAEGIAQSVRVTAIPQHIKDTIAQHKVVIF